RQPEEEDEAAALRGHRPIDGGEARIAPDALLDDSAGEIAPHEKGHRGAERRRDEDVHRAPGEPEDGARRQGQEGSRHEGNGRAGVAEHEHGRPPDPGAPARRREARQGGARHPPEENERHETAPEEDDPAEGNLRARSLHRHHTPPFPGFRIPAGSSAAFTRRSTSSARGPCSPGMRWASFQPTPWQYSMLPPPSGAARRIPSMVVRSAFADPSGPATTTE